jgi:hypothetical protein
MQEKNMEKNLVERELSSLMQRTLEMENELMTLGIKIEE